MAKLDGFLPVPAIQVAADTPVSICIELMRKHQVGSVLILSEDEKREPIGIFTERDLLNKFHIISREHRAAFPIRDVMSSPIKTLDVNHLDRAHSMMLEHNVRHLPITVTDEAGVSKLVGIISM